MKNILKLLFVLSLSGYSFCQTVDSPVTNISDIDRSRISEAYKIAKSVGENLWENWSEVPFAILFITDDYEYLIQHPNPSNDFTLLNYDEKLRSYIYYRPRSFPKNLLATFPAVNGLSTVVIGKTENTSVKNSTRWVLTLLHEHFHQFQNFQPNYYSSVNSLDLSKGDQTGMWMLNYNFPYDSLEVKESFSKLSKMLSGLIKDNSQESLQISIEEYLLEREKFKNIIKEDDYKYFSFQLWGEGISRFVEYEIANYIDKNYKVSDEFKMLEDYTGFILEADSIYQRIMKNLEIMDMGDLKRVAFYPFGAAEAILIDRINKDWKSKYFTEMFYLEKYFN